MAIKIQKSKTPKNPLAAPACLTHDEQVATFIDAIPADGEVFVVPSILAGLDSTEPVKLELIERFHLPGDEAEVHRLTFRATWHGIFLSNMIALTDATNRTVTWPAPKENVA